MMVEFKHMKFLNKTASVKDGKLVVDLGKDGLKDVPEGDYFASCKLDGVLCAFKGGRMLSSSNKDIPNVQLREQFQKILDHSEKMGLTLTGELYCHEMTFQEIISIVMSKSKEVPENFKFHCFDCIDNDDYEMQFEDRILLIPELKNLVKVEQVLISSSEAEKFDEFFHKNLDAGYEGLIIKNRIGAFKCGRTTLNSGTGFKFKPYITVDAEILGVNQATRVREGAEKKINELGRSETSKKKDDRVLIEQASTFTVQWDGMEFDVTIAEKDDEKKKIWAEKEKYIGEFVEIKFMMVGAKDKPRHPTTLRIRWRSQQE